MTDKPEEDEPKKVKGRLFTLVECVCGDVYDINGDQDGAEIECPGCKSKTVVYREDK